MSVMKSLSPEFARCRLYCGEAPGRQRAPGPATSVSYYSPSFLQFAATFPAQISAFVG